MTFNSPFHQMILWFHDYFFKCIPELKQGLKFGAGALPGPIFNSEVYRRAENTFFFPLLFWWLILFPWWQVLCKYLRDMFCAVRSTDFHILSKCDRLREEPCTFCPCCTNSVYIRNGVQGHQENMSNNLNGIFWVIFAWIWKLLSENCIKENNI